WPYGYPRVMSSYAFTTESQGPPSDPGGRTHDIYGAEGKPNCFKEWKCEHRWRSITNMVAFRNATASNFFTTDWWSNGNNQIAFGRGDKGFVVINREKHPLQRAFQTSLPAGIYCNVIDGDVSEDGSQCTGSTVTVDDEGRAEISVPFRNAVAVHVGAKLSW
ncbi:MAG: ATPase, partial [Merismopedia sp. SIO2A8]|nr:ATPase [Merismopedia sp. SIO2A8]